MSQSYRVGIVGATGAVGQELIKLLVERSFPVAEWRLLASARSVGKKVTIAGREVEIQEAKLGAFAGLDVAFFAADGAIAKALAPDAAAAGAVVLDKSSAFRMSPEVPLVVPEVNGHVLDTHKGIIASPNCSTAIALMALAPLHKEFGLVRYFASTYQSVSGTGADAVVELEQQARAWAAGTEAQRSVYPHPIAFNLFPHIDSFGEDGYTGEETKMRLESRKILGLPELKVSSTCVRVPVIRAHSVAVQAEFSKPVDVARARAVVAAFPGAELIDEPSKNAYPTPLAYTRQVKCGVGRIRRDTALDNGLSFFVSGDNLWKGAALNSLQIAEELARRGKLGGKK